MSARDQSPGGAGTGHSGRGLRRRLSQELTAFVAIAVLKALSRLPEVVAWNLADVAGAISYRTSRGRREHARRNLRRVVGYLAANGMADERTVAAASDPKALERLVKSAFRNHGAYYVELARIGRFGGAWLKARMAIDTPAEIDEWVANKGAQVLVGMHFGAIELPGRFALEMVGELTSPMETLTNPRLQRYVTSVRTAPKLHIFSLEDSGDALLAALRRGEPVGIVADRDLTGGGIDTELFGAMTKIPAGPAVLAGQTGAPMYVSGVRRTGHGRYLGSLWKVPEPQGASRRERSRNLIREEARLFEKIVATAPEQWLAIFHPIWPDLESMA